MVFVQGQQRQRTVVVPATPADKSLLNPFWQWQQPKYKGRGKHRRSEVDLHSPRYQTVVQREPLMISSPGIPALNASSPRGYHNSQIQINSATSLCCYNLHVPTFARPFAQMVSKRFLVRRSRLANGHGWYRPCGRPSRLTTRDRLAVSISPENSGCYVQQSIDLSSTLAIALRVGEKDR